jgi:hypothetical protein
VAGREVRGDRDAADAQHLAVFDHLDVLDRRETIERLAKSVLRIVGRIFTAAERIRPRRARRDSGAAGPLERRNAAGMVVMSVRVDDQLDVFGLETQLTDVGVDQSGRLFEPAIKQDQACVPGDQDG